MAIPAETFFLPHESENTLQQQIQQVVVEAIISGRCTPGEKMPSSRTLAKHLGVARITVMHAYGELVANEYLVSRDRSGYFVADTAPQRHGYALAREDSEDLVDWSRKISTRFSNAAPPILRPSNWRDYKYPFIYGQSDARLFDHSNWRNCALKAVGRKDFDTLISDHYERDDPLLVEFILRHILPRRGIAAKPSEILVTMGGQHALWMTAQILLTQRRTAVLETPCYPGLRQVLLQSRCKTHMVGVDRLGLPPDAIPRDADVVFVTPSHQAPTNATMPLHRRQELLRRASEDDFIVIEDDYEFEMALLNAPSPSLKSLDRKGSVVYLGSFSKSIFPGLRLGYMVAPEPFIREARALRTVVVRHPPSHVQRTTAYFLSLGHFDAQIARMIRVYRKRRQVMEDALVAHGLVTSDQLTFGGSSFWLTAPERVDTTKLALHLRKDSVVIEPGVAFFPKGSDQTRHYRLAYSSIDADRIADGIAILARRLRDIKDAGGFEGLELPQANA